MRKRLFTIIAVLLFILQISGINCSSFKGPNGASDTDTIPAIFSLVTAPNNNLSNGMVDFVVASKAVMPAVVHIKTSYKATSSGNNFGQQSGGASGTGITAVGSASGVIITGDGYIATNNHVVENAMEIEVILPDKQVFAATLIGRDPNTDLALLKINAVKLPIVKLGNSEIVEVGQWVLVVGYPFSLNTTVTAGIVSAKTRSIGIINRPGSLGNSAQEGNTGIESFIQTDAAINLGNSGGALVNTNGELIGINSAIASQTGSYAGYAFAVPVNLAKKILDDLKNYGCVKRGILGVLFPAPAQEDHYFKQQGLTPGSVKGVT